MRQQARIANDGGLAREALRAARTSPRVVLLVGASGLVLAALFVVSWLVFVPVGALVVAPATLLLSLALGTAPSALANSAAAVALSGALAAATVSASLRVLLRRARARHRASTVC